MIKRGLKTRLLLPDLQHIQIPLLSHHLKNCTLSFPLQESLSNTGLSKLIQFSSAAQSCPTLCDPMDRSTPGLLGHHQLPKFTQTHVHRVMRPSSHLILCRPLLPLPPIPPSIRVFPNESTLCMRWPKYWSFSFSIGLTKKCWMWCHSILQIQRSSLHVW